MTGIAGWSVGAGMEGLSNIPFCSTWVLEPRDVMEPAVDRRLVCREGEGEIGKKRETGRGRGGREGEKEQIYSTLWPQTAQGISNERSSASDAETHIGSLSLELVRSDSHLLHHLGQVLLVDTAVVGHHTLTPLVHVDPTRWTRWRVGGEREGGGGERGERGERGGGERGRRGEKEGKGRGDGRRRKSELRRK